MRQCLIELMNTFEYIRKYTTASILVTYTWELVAQTYANQRTEKSKDLVLTKLVARIELCVV